MNRFSISTRIMVAFGAMLALLALTALTSIVSNRTIAQSAKDVAGRRVLILNDANAVTVSVLHAARHTRNTLILDADKVPEEIAKVRSQKARREMLFASLRARVKSQESTRLLADLMASGAAYDAPKAHYLALIEARSRDEVRTYLIGTMRPAQPTFVTSAEKFSASQQAMVAAAAVETESVSSNAQIAVVAIGLVSAGVAAAVGMTLTRSIVRPIEQAVRVADGTAHRHDQEQRRHGARSQPTRGRCQHGGARRWCRGGRVHGHDGRHQRQLQAHRRHHRRDRRHRLPDQHPGAQRCRGGGACRRAGPRLCVGGERGAQPGAAQRQRRKEIKGLIDDSVANVERGSALVGKAGDTMTNLVSQVQRVTNLIDEISTAARAQTTGIGQVNDAVSQLDQVTQQNASLVEESAAASESLRQQSHRLIKAVSVFQTAIV